MCLFRQIREASTLTPQCTLAVRVVSKTLDGVNHIYVIGVLFMDEVENRYGSMTLAEHVSHVAETGGLERALLCYANLTYTHQWNNYDKIKTY